MSEKPGKPCSCPRCLVELAAAEERGRRAGIEAHIRDLEAIEKRLDEFVDRGGTFGGIRVVYEYVTLAIAALAPRDSGKEDRK